VYRDAAGLVSNQLALAGVQARADLQPERAHGVGYRARTAHSARGAVKGGKEAIAGGVDLAPAELGQFAADQGVVTVKQVVLVAVAECWRLTRLPNTW
jgi:hypothetical protein